MRKYALIQARPALQWGRFGWLVAETAAAGWLMFVLLYISGNWN